MIQGVVFDADGTLLDSTRMWTNIGALYLEGRGIQPEPGLGERLFPLSLPDATAYLIDRYALPVTVEEVAREVNDMVGRFYSTQVELKPGVLAFLQDLRRRGIPMTVATATDRVAIEKGLEHTGIGDFFQGLFTCTEVGAGKEKPDVYLAAAAHLGGEVSQTWVFEDALHGAETAKRAGFSVAAVYDWVSERHQEALRQTADLYLPDMTDMTAFFRLAGEPSA